MTIDTTEQGGTNEVAPRADNTPQPQADRTPDSDLVLWAYEAERAFTIAKSLVRTNFVPQSFKGSAENVAAAILAGSELGLRPMTALRSMDIIQGTPGLRAHAMRGLVQSHGHKVKLVYADDARVVMKGRRADEGDDEYQEIEWTIDRAQQLGLTSKDQWKKQPKSMLIARATGEICRLIASDVLHAMPYASEELDSSGNSDGSAQVPRVTVRELAPDAPEAQEQPSGEPGEAPTELPEDDPWYVRPSGDVDEHDEALFSEDAR